METSLATVTDQQAILFALNALAILLAIYIAASFLLSLVRLFLGDRLRRALLEKNASEQVVALMLPTTIGMRETALKWSCLLIAGALGLTVCHYSQPMGLHWAIIMSLSLAAGLLVYYVISKPKQGKS